MISTSCYHACMERQLTVRGVPSEVRRRLTSLSRARGDSMNTTIRRILERAVGAAGRPPPRRRHLEQYATWNADDAADFDRALAEQRTIDADLWR
jgi:plasmid stability protein